MAKYILTFIWGAATTAFWFLAWNKLGVEDMTIPNGFMYLGVISTAIAIIVSVFRTKMEN